MATAKMAIHIHCEDTETINDPTIQAIAEEVRDFREAPQQRGEELDRAAGMVTAYIQQHDATPITEIEHIGADCYRATVTIDDVRVTYSCDGDGAPMRNEMDVGIRISGTWYAVLTGRYDDPNISPIKEAVGIEDV